jgi:hypothetical protein
MLGVALGDTVVQTPTYVISASKYFAHQLPTQEDAICLKTQVRDTRTTVSREAHLSLSRHTGKRIRNRLHSESPRHVCIHRSTTIELEWQECTHYRRVKRHRKSHSYKLRESWSLRNSPCRTLFPRRHCKGGQGSGGKQWSPQTQGPEFGSRRDRSS